MESIHLTVFSTAAYMHATQIPALEAAFPGNVKCLDVPLSADTAPLAAGSNAVCLFVNDVADADAIDALADLGVRFIAMRCAGFDRVDLDRCRARGVAVVRVPAYSPHAIAEHTVALMLALNRQLIKANARVTQGNYSLSGLVGFDMHGKTVGVIGTGKIGRGVASILLEWGAKCWRTTCGPRRSRRRGSPVRRHRRGTPSAMPRCHASLPSDPRYAPSDERRTSRADVPRVDARQHVARRAGGHVGARGCAGPTQGGVCGA